MGQILDEPCDLCLGEEGWWDEGWWDGFRLYKWIDCPSCHGTGLKHVEMDEDGEDR